MATSMSGKRDKRIDSARKIAAEGGATLDPEILFKRASKDDLERYTPEMLALTAAHAQREIARADFALASLPPGTVLLDEWQKLPQVWDSVRRQVDAGASPGRFLLTGSATPVDAGGTHSGAGRILSLRMRPMGLHERGLVTPSVSLAALLSGMQDEVSGAASFALRDYAEAIVGSGFPGILGAAPRLRNGLLDAYLQRIIDRDLPEQGYEVRSLRAFDLFPMTHHVECVAILVPDGGS